MIQELIKVTPERRVTIGSNVVLCVACNRDDPYVTVENKGTLLEKRTISPTLWNWIQNEEVVVQAIGKEHPHKLNRYAAESFKTMREAAKSDGIDLKILPGVSASDRDKTAADTGCKKAANPWAVACFPNSHNLGLAVDLYMSTGAQKYCGTCTQPMQNVVDMRQSVVHKWLILNAAKYGWHPFTHEPWHWEYNHLQTPYN